MKQNKANYTRQEKETFGLRSKQQQKDMEKTTDHGTNKAKLLCSPSATQ